MEKKKADSDLLASMVVGTIFFGIGLFCTFWASNSLNRNSGILWKALELREYDRYKLAKSLEEAVSQSGT